MFFSKFSLQRNSLQLINETASNAVCFDKNYFLQFRFLVSVVVADPANKV